MNRYQSLTISALFVFCQCGCGPSQRAPDVRWLTVPVVGMVHVDGAPVAGVAATATPEPGAEIAYPVSTRSQPDGKFAFGVYRSGDGLPVGNFKLTFQLQKSEKFGQSNDVLHGRYDNLKEPIKVFQVEKGEPVDLGVIELSTKATDK